jgi:hypothetical protein
MFFFTALNYDLVVMGRWYVLYCCKESVLQKIGCLEKNKMFWGRASPVGEEDPAPEETMRRAARDLGDAVDHCWVEALAAELVDQLVST